MNCRLVGVLVLGLALSGCGDGTGGPGYVSVSGVVTLDDQPVEGATVIFTPKGEGTMSMAVTNAEGHFSLTTATGKKGAAIGDHVITVSLIAQPEAATPTGSADDLAPQLASEFATPAAAAQAAADAKSKEPVYLVPRKYTDPQTSGLTASVPSGGLSGYELKLTAK